MQNNMIALQYLTCKSAITHSVHHYDTTGNADDFCIALAWGSLQNRWEVIDFCRHLFFDNASVPLGFLRCSNRLPTRDCSESQKQHHYVRKDLHEAPQRQ